MRVTRVKVRPFEPIPGHRIKEWAKGKTGLRDQHAGEWVRVYLPPKPPDDPRWTCGCDLIWRVHEDDIRRIRGHDGPYHVCHHQVEID